MIDQMTADELFEALNSGSLSLDAPFLGDVTSDTLAAAVADIKKFSKHNAELAANAELGTAFRIAFKPPGATSWIRVRLSGDALLRQMVINELESRQISLMESLYGMVADFVSGILKGD